MQKRVFLFYFLSTFLFVACSSRKNLSSSKNNTAVVQKYARIMDVPKKKIKNPELYQFIDEWIGTRYQFGGLSKNGIDCSGFTHLLYKEVYHKNIPRNTAEQVKIIKRKYEGQLKEGDLVFFDYDKKKFSHVGLFLQNGYYVHASTRRGVMVQKLKDPYTYKYFSRGGSVK